MNIALFSKTPTATVLDNRGLTVRDIAWHRHPATPEVTDERISRHRYDARGHLTQSADPRLHDAGRLNLRYLTDLAGGVLRTDSADAGTSVAISDAAGRPFIAISNIRTDDDGTQERSQALTRTWQYEEAALPGRPLSVTETLTGQAARITERFVWAGNSAEDKSLNLSGQCVSHYDTAGMTQTDSVALTGGPLSVTRRLLQGADNPDTMADWQGPDASAWNARLDAETYTTLTAADATGALLTTTDAAGHVQRMAYDVAGLLAGSWLTLKGGTEQVIVSALTWSAAGQKLREEHGNGVVTTWSYEPETQRLTGMKSERPAAHAAGAKVLQDLRYEYDPVGNVLKVSNDAEKTRFWRNQKVVPENTCTYDSLYQLVSATGREMANAGQQGSGLPSATVPLPTDSAAYTRYTRTYTYDRAGNLTQVRHSPATGSGYTTSITISGRSNRGVLSTLAENPADVEALFTAGGQQTQLQPGQRLLWTPRNELLKVTPVVRDGSTDDSESYRYDDDSQRVLKVSVQKSGNSTQTQRALCLPGLELRVTTAGDTKTESLQVITVGEAGRAQVRVLHWESGRPDGIGDDQVRYSYDNLTGSSSLELDGDGYIISQEEYYPYGGTAVWTARSAVEADYKTVRYSGKERDATGLYYYGYRYYQPWAGRWLSADPAGTVDGLNLFRMVQNNPATCEDAKGESTQNRNRNIFRLLTPGLYRRGDYASESLTRGIKSARAIAGGLAVAGLAVTAVATAGASLAVIAAIGVGGFAIGAIAGWNITRITEAISGFLKRILPGRSATANTLAGSVLASATARLTGAGIQGTLIAGVAGGASGALGWAIDNPDRGMGGAHAAGIAVGTVNIMAGSDVSYAMEITSATFGAVGGFITGTRGSTLVGEHAAYGSYIGGMAGRYADNAIAYTFNMAGRGVAESCGQAILTHYTGNNFLTRALGRRIGGFLSSLFSRSIAIGGGSEWAGSAFGAALGGILTAVSVASPDAHFRNRINQLGRMLDYAGGYVIGWVRRSLLPAAVINVARDVIVSAGRQVFRSLSPI